jgi:putative transposase
MTTHYHLVVRSTRKHLSQGHHLLNGIYAQRFNRRYDRPGYLFGARFGSRVIEAEQYLYDASSRTP